MRAYAQLGKGANMTDRLSSWLVRLLCWLVTLVAACGVESSNRDVVLGGYESDDPSYFSGPGGDAFLPDEDAPLALENVDITHLDSGRLYTLSHYAGLSILDVSVQDELHMLGRYRTKGVPFSLFVRDHTVFLVFSSYAAWYWDEGRAGHLNQLTSRILALDTSDPANVVATGMLDVPGEIFGARVVGDKLYVVSFEDGYCYRCEDTATAITSIDIADPAGLRLVDRESFAERFDENRFEFSKHIVTVAQDRIYLGRVERDQGTDAHSIIQVIDITDPGGKLEIGASVRVEGQLEGSWQMDEYDGTLRVVSQELGNVGPSVETFTIVSSEELHPLGHLGLALPPPALLSSIVFDGDRAFALVHDHTDTLLTIDLRDPAYPKQPGVLATPEWIHHLVPRGNVLLTLGIDGRTEEGMALSLWDISDMAEPTMLDREVFGGPWTISEDPFQQARSIHVFDSEGFILFPYSHPASESESCQPYTSGIELVDFTQGRLTKRGTVPQRGDVRRLFVHDERLFTLTDVAVSTFDLADRDAPSAKSEVALSHIPVRTTVVGESLVRIEGDWWTREPRLSVVPLGDPERDDPIGSLGLAGLSSACNWSFLSLNDGSAVRSLDSYVVFIWRNEYYEYEPNMRGTDLAVFDLADPSQPRLVSHKTFDLFFSRFGGPYYGFRSHPFVLATGEAIVQVGSTLALLAYPTGATNAPQNYRLHLLDLADPANPTFASTVDLPAGLGQTPLLRDGTTLLTSHWESVPGRPRKVRFFIDRVDVGTPGSPQVLPSINVPGSLIAHDPATGRVATVDYLGEAVPVDQSNCWSEGIWDRESERCLAARRTVNLLDIQGSEATLVDSLTLEAGDYGQVASGQDRVYFLRRGWMESSQTYGATVRTLSGFADGNLQLSEATILPEPYFSWLALIPHRERVVALGYYPSSVAVLDATELLASPRLIASEELRNRIYDVTVQGDQVICALGRWGVQQVPAASD